MKPLAFDAMVHFELPVAPHNAQTSHLTDEEWEKGVQEKLDALRAKNTRALNAGTHPQDRRWHRLRDISGDGPAENPLVFAQGLHPWWVGDDAIKLLVLLENQLDHPGSCCVAIGECGLDKNAQASQADQRTVFSAQLQMAAARSLPVVVHVVGWQGLAVECIRNNGVQGMVHGFCASEEILNAYLELGWYLSIGKTILTSSKTKTAAKMIPDGRILLESDEGDFYEIAKEMARIRGTSVEHLISMTTTNAHRLFKM